MTGDPIRDIRIRFNLTARAAAVLRTMLSDGWEYRGSVRDVAAATGLSESTVKRGLRELQGKGLIVGHGRRGRHKNRYRVREEVIDGRASFAEDVLRQPPLPKPRVRVHYTETGTELRPVEPVQAATDEPVHTPAEPVHPDPVEPVHESPEPVHPHESIENSNSQSLNSEGGEGGNRFTRWAWTTEQLRNAEFVDAVIVPMAIDRFGLPDCDATIQGIQAAAVCAVKHPKSRKPAAVFTGLVKRSAWKQRGKGGIAEKWFDQAKALRMPAERDGYSDQLANENAERREFERRKAKALRDLDGLALHLAKNDREERCTASR